MYECQVRLGTEIDILPPINTPLSNLPKDVTLKKSITLEARTGVGPERVGLGRDSKWGCRWKWWSNNYVSFNSLWGHLGG